MSRPTDDEIDSNNMDWKQIEKDIVQAMREELSAAQAQIREFAALMQEQEKFIQDLKGRLKDKGYPVLEKSVWELTREELSKRNKEIPHIRFNQVKTKDKIPMPSPDAEFKMHESVADERSQEAMSKLFEMITDGVDLEKHGIDPVTLNFKEGFGPTATPPPKVEYVDYPSHVKKYNSLWQKFKRFLFG